MRLPPPLEIRSPQRIVSLQYLYDQIELQFLSIEASRCGATNIILREPFKACFKYIEGHAVLRSPRTVARVVKHKYPAKPLVQCERQARTSRTDIAAAATTNLFPDIVGTEPKCLIPLRFFRVRGNNGWRVVSLRLGIPTHHLSGMMPMVPKQGSPHQCLDAGTAKAVRNTPGDIC